VQSRQGEPSISRMGFGVSPHLYAAKPHHFTVAIAVTKKALPEN
jgi:hypothetical protein